MVAEGHSDSQKARRGKERKTRARGEVQGDSEVKGDRQESRKDTEEAKQGVEADTAEMQAQVQTVRGSWKYRNAGLSYAAARAVVVMQHQSEEAWFRREAEAEAAGEERAAQPKSDSGASRGEAEVKGDSEVLGDRQKRGPRGEGTAGPGAQVGPLQENSGGGSMLEMGAGGDRAQGTRQRAEVGCHWSGSESSGDTESGSGEPESGNRLEVSEVQSDTETECRRGEDGNAEGEADTTQGGSDGSREGLRGGRGRGDQVQKWKEFWQRTEEKGMGEGAEEAQRDAEETEERGARLCQGRR